MCADMYEPSLISPSRLVATPPALGVAISSALWDRLAATLFLTPIKHRQGPTKQQFWQKPAFFFFTQLNRLSFCDPEGVQAN